jgi:hypothetical protein
MRTTSSSGRAVVVLAAVLLLHQFGAGAEAGCWVDPSFRPSNGPLLQRGVVLGEGWTCLTYGRKTIALPEGRSKRVTSIIGEFEHDGRRIRFETLRGDRLSTADRYENPDAPRYEVDARFFSPEGDNVVRQMGGCHHIDDGWEHADDDDGDAEEEEELPPGFEAGRLADFALIERAIDSLRAMPFKRKYESEYKVLLGQQELARQGRSPLVMDPSMLIIDEETPPAETGPDPSGRTHNDVYRHVIQVWSIPVISGLHVPEHSATVAYRVLPNGFVQEAWNACNHGRCYYNMNTFHAQRCAFRSAFNRKRHVHQESCSTPYHWRSIFGRHNCNDDAAIQYRAVRQNQHFPSSQGTCSDPFRNDFGDPCW